ncbi:MAG: uracil-DNA glycosylase [Thiohalomonadaceae bacterium]
MSYSSRQGQYLSAMGIQRWVLREQPEEPGRVDKRSASTSEPVPDKVELSSPLPLGERGEGESANIPALPDIASLDWEALQQQVAACQHCSELSATRSQTVFGVGNRQAEWLIIGEAPGTEEEQQGEPFVGPAGQLLNAMLAATGLSRPQVYIANVLKCRPPNNRDPHSDETAACLSYLHRQIALIQPRMILLLGRVAAQQLLGSNAKIGELRGQVHRYKNNIPMIATYHPAYLLRKPGEKRKAWEDLCLARAQLEAR